MQSKITRSAKQFPLPTTVELTKAVIQQYAQVVSERALKQIEVCDKRERGLRAIIYASGRVVFHARYFWLKRSQHKKLGEFGTLTIEQARAKNREIRSHIAQGRDPKGLRRGKINLEKFFTEHYAPHASGTARNCWRKPSIRVIANLDPHNPMQTRLLPPDSACFSNLLYRGQVANCPKNRQPEQRKVGLERAKGYRYGRNSKSETEKGCAPTMIDNDLRRSSCDQKSTRQQKGQPTWLA